MGLNVGQIRLVQAAVRAAGLRTRHFDGQYRMLLRQYKQPNGQPVDSCKQLNNSQLEDLLAICEAHGWCYPGKEENFYRAKIAKRYEIASFAQQSAIKKLAGDLGWADYQLAGFIKKMTGDKVNSVAALTPAQAYRTIEGLKAILCREAGKRYSNLKQIEADYTEVATDGKANQI